MCRMNDDEYVSKKFHFVYITVTRDTKRDARRIKGGKEEGSRTCSGREREKGTHWITALVTRSQKYQTIM